MENIASQETAWDFGESGTVRKIARKPVQPLIINPSSVESANWIDAKEDFLDTSIENEQVESFTDEDHIPTLIPEPPITPRFGWPSVRIIKKERPMSTNDTPVTRSRIWTTQSVGTIKAQRPLKAPHDAGNTFFSSLSLESDSTVSLPNTSFLQDTLTPLLQSFAPRTSKTKLKQLLLTLRAIEDDEEGLVFDICSAVSSIIGSQSQDKVRTGKKGELDETATDLPSVTSMI